MADRTPTKITKYRKPININIGMLIFGVMFVYILICIIMYFKTSHLTGYEVKTGSLSEDNVYHGIALRTEKIYTSPAAGYVYYFVPEGSHVGNTSLVYAVDSAGTLSETLNTGSDKVKLSDKNLSDFRSNIISYRSHFNRTQFSTVYDFKTELDNEITNISNNSLLDSLSSLNAASAGITKYNADSPGDITYFVDGYETLTSDNITENSFDETKYKKTQFASNDLVGKGDSVYKLISSEDWSVVIQVSSDKAAELEKDGYVLVKFLKDQYETYGKVTVHGSTKDGKKKFVELSFSNSMLSYISDRFLDIELVLEEKKGLKIPNSSIAQKKFFLVPKDYVIQGGSDGNPGVLRKTYTKDNKPTTEFVETTIYGESNGKYYLGEDVLNAGSVLCKENSNDTCTVSDQAALVGVFNINKGYADFRQITILYQNDEYSIVESNTQYGLNDYDYIALDAATVKDDQFVNE